MSYKILDCTLRDGGYYTNWNFSDSMVKKYLNVLSKLPIDCLEVGYISNNLKDDFGLFYHLTPHYLKKIKKKLNKNQKIACMINTKEIKNHKDLINLLLPFNNCLDTVRFAIDPKNLDKTLKIISLAKTKITKIKFNLNLMYMSNWYKDFNYSNNLILKSKKVADEIALVDSYGSLKPLEVYKFFKNIIKINKDTKIGCHFHNNSGLALANTISAIEAGCSTADTTLQGMGRGAGNAETELLLSILKPNNINISSYEFDELLEKFQVLKSKLKWGSSFSYSFSAVKGFSQSEMMDLIQKRRLDTSIAIATISSSLKKNNKIKFKNLNQLSFLKKKTPLLIGGAPSFLQEGALFLSNLNEDITIILSGSNAFKHFTSLKMDLKNKIILLLSGSEMKKIKEIKKKNFLNKNNINHLVIEKDFMAKEFKNFDKKRIIISESTALNPLLLTGKLLMSLKLKKLNLAYFDGDFQTEKGRLVMRETEESLKILKNKIKIKTLTKSYLEVPKINLWNNPEILKNSS